jgi:uncharacterized protein with von Willebrand factor type A (vWA) domain
MEDTTRSDRVTGPGITGPIPSNGNLLRNCVLFGRLLRNLGVAITPTQIVDLVDALRYVDLRSREDFKCAARAVLVSRHEHLILFEIAFHLFWQARHRDELAQWDMGGLMPNRPREQRQQRTSNGGMSGDSVAESDDEALDRTFAYSAEELLRRKDFARLDDAELAAIKRLMSAIRWSLPPRRTRRTLRMARGELIDLRTTIRHSLRHGGEPLRLARRSRKHKRRPLVVICDISGSMERYSRVLLQFIYAVTTRLDRVESFVFSTRLTRITRQLRGRDVDGALAAASHAVHDWGGGTRIGDAIKSFNYVWGRRVLGQGAVVLIISDGWDRGDVELLGREMDRLHRSCYRLLWLNPLLGYDGYEPLVRGIQAILPHIDDFLPVHNLASLEQLAHALATES